MMYRGFQEIFVAVIGERKGDLKSEGIKFNKEIFVAEKD